MTLEEAGKRYADAVSAAVEAQRAREVASLALDATIIAHHDAEARRETALQNLRRTALGLE